MSDWKSLASAKRDSILSSIPEKWRLPADKLPSNKEQRDVTKYVHQFLSEKEIEITETDLVGIAEKTASGTWSAVEVTEAFCHRAGLAHQLVSTLKHSSHDPNTDGLFRQTASTKHSSLQPSPMRKLSTNTSPKKENPWARYTGCPSP
jgi:hypothetical protein